MDSVLVQKFNKMVPNSETAEPLWNHLIERISNLHGTELAAQTTANLASFKRKANSSKCAKRPESRTLHVKLEQLREVKMQKRINIRNETPIDLTDIDLPEPVFETKPEKGKTHPTHTAEKAKPHPTHSPQFHLGETITAIEGTGSATKQWSGVVVEVDQCDEVFIICCENVPNYPHGYMMVVPFSEAKTRINQQLHGRKRKRKRKQIQSM